MKFTYICSLKNVNKYQYLINFKFLSWYLPSTQLLILGEFLQIQSHEFHLFVHLFSYL